MNGLRRIKKRAQPPYFFVNLSKRFLKLISIFFSIKPLANFLAIKKAITAPKTFANKVIVPPQNAPKIIPPAT